jgi:dolichol-phosphate mannosyltransferase
VPACIVIPTYNERDTLPVLLRRLARLPRLGQLRCDVVIVDDSSPDGTGEVARQLGGELQGLLPVTVLTRPGKAGLASAVLAGVRQSRADVIAVMDGDLSHPPEVLPQLLEAVSGGADLAIGSRYVAGGAIENWPVRRHILSWGATWLARTLFRLGPRDPMSGLFAVRRTVFDNVRFEGLGYKLLLEILASGQVSRIEEVAYRFTERADGRSKLGSGEIVNYVRLLGRLWRRRSAGRRAPGR